MGAWRAVLGRFQRVFLGWIWIDSISGKYYSAAADCDRSVRLTRGVELQQAMPVPAWGITGNARDDQSKPIFQV